jgi:hypothetical protein
MDTTTDRQVATASTLTEQQLFINKFQELLSSQQRAGITLTNIYKEIPISYPASICEIRGHCVELETCELQLAAISHCNEVYIKSPLLDAPILGQLDRIDVRRGTVHLANFCYQELFVNSRNTVRVRFKTPISIVAQAGRNKISGVIHDISLGGCCIKTLVRQWLQETDDIVLYLKVVEDSSGQGLSMEIPSTLVRATGDAPPFLCALRFNHTPQSEQLLSVYINQRQLEILKELRESL